MAPHVELYTGIGRKRRVVEGTRHATNDTESAGYQATTSCLEHYRLSGLSAVEVRDELGEPCDSHGKPSSERVE